MKVKAKKHLGQHFLRDLKIAEAIVQLYEPEGAFESVLEIGSGMGVLTQFLKRRTDLDLSVIEIDRESVQYLEAHYPDLKIFAGDFIQMDLTKLVSAQGKVGIIGNFPYNISSQIFFKILNYVDIIDQVVGMVQKEVGQRIASAPGNKDYGILSVLLQAYYDIDYAFSVPPDAFDPPPKVNSGVIRLVKNGAKSPEFEYKKLKLVVKTAFNQRRKKLSNALKPLGIDNKDNPYADMRAEQLDYLKFIELSRLL